MGKLKAIPAHLYCVAPATAGELREVLFFVIRVCNFLSS